MKHDITPAMVRRAVRLAWRERDEALATARRERDEAIRECDALREELRLTNAAGDQMLRALLYCAQYGTPPEPGELCIEVTSFALDWSRVGYYIRTEGKYPDEAHVMQCLEGRERRWRNARFARINTTWPARLEIEGQEDHA